MNKVINLALSPPGAGKTYSACAEVAKMLRLGKKVLFVVPTKPLGHQLLADLSNYNPFYIESSPGDPSIAKLNKHLHPKESTHLIICMHAAFDKCNKKLLRQWVVIVDELPHQLSLNPASVPSRQIDMLQHAYQTEHGRLALKDGHVRVLLQDIKIYEGRSKKNGMDTLLSERAYLIYKALLDKRDVYVSSGDKKAATIAYYEEGGFLDRFEYAREVHLLSATYKGSVFEWFASAKNFVVARSVMTPPQPKPHPQRITVLPLLKSGQCSKGVLDSVHSKDDDGSEVRVYQAVINKVINWCKSKCLVFAHSWAQIPYDDLVEICPLDSRGMNCYQHIHNVICLFHGNPLPTAMPMIDVISAKYGKSSRSLREALRQTDFYDRLVQCIYRCSIRDRKSMEEVFLFVQNIEAAEFLINNFMPNAHIDYSLMAEYKVKDLPGPKSKFAQFEARAMELALQGLKPRQIVKLIPEVEIEYIYEVNRKIRANA